MLRHSLWCYCFLAVVTVAATSHAQTRTLRAVGVAQTGPNNQCGAQVWTLAGVPAGPESSGNFLGRRDNSLGATKAIALTPSICDPDYGLPNALIATNYDDAFGAVRGWTVPNVLLENLSLQSVPVPAGNGVYAPIPLPGSVPPNPLPPTITQPTDAVLLGNWLAADGDLEIICDDINGTASIAARMSGLIPHRVYTMWGTWADAVGELVTTPIGGLPNVLVADRLGNAEFCRAVQFCPLDLAPDSSELQYLSAVYMGAAGQTYGSEPYEAFTTGAYVGVDPLPFLSSRPGGIVAFDHLSFRINATGGPDPGPTSPPMCVAPALPAAAMPNWGLGSLCAGILLGVSVLLRRTAVRSQ
ncbi:MAG: hypothetical protein JRG80_11640 [Deltaproteobacteria bacterium]|nr:hypothetical protein [Deltaproteobacteria bacterium]